MARNVYFDSTIVEDVLEQVERYGYCFMEFRKRTDAWLLHFSGLDCLYRVSKDYFNQLERIDNNKVDLKLEMKECLSGFFSDLKGLYILNESIRASKGKISCVLCSDKVNIHVVNSIDSLIHNVSDIRKANPDFNIYFRGELARWIPIPSLFRNRNYVLNEVINDEKVISLVPNEFENCKTDFEKLVKLKHYSEPSRLLDLTKSPLVALFFALECMEKYTNDLGIIRVCFSDPEKEKVASVSDTVSFLTGIAKTNARKCRYCEKKKVDCYDCEVQNEECEFFSELQYRVRRITGIDYDWSGDKIRRSISKCVIVHPPYNNYRIIQQQGLFILCGRNNEDVLACPDRIINMWKNPKTKANEYFLISPDSCQKLKDELESLGINKYYIYGSLEDEIDSVVKNKVLK